ncbi:MAG: NAD(+) synthase [Clostridium sp.]|jgi:NAD+ synthase (glutamine-hydrolysing)|nr:NAD(+) synthase [Clostridium sp.]
MYGFIKVRAAAPRVFPANPALNAKAAVAAIRDAAEAKVQVIVLPELFLSGYSCGDLFRQGALLKGCEAALKALLEQTTRYKLLCAVGLPVQTRDGLYNCAAVFQSGVLLGLIPKSYLPNHNEYYEKRWFTPYPKKRQTSTIDFAGQSCPFGSSIFEFCAASPGAPTVKIGVEICEDMWMPISPGTEYALHGAQLILNLSASDALVGKQQYRRELLRQYSGKNLCVVAYASAGAGESSTDLVFSGACAVAENGAILSEGERFRQAGSYCDACIDVCRIDSERINYTFFDNLDRAGEDYVSYISSVKGEQPLRLPELTENDIERRFDPTPFVPSNTNERAERCAEILNIQAAGLAQRVSHTGSKRLVLGLSGGLDSTLALIVCAKTCSLLERPASDILCVSMPGFGTTRRTKSNAKALASAFGAEYKEIDITAACERHMADIGHDSSVHDITYENTQARERTQILMDLANACGGLVVGTGDLSELALGWCTYNADHMSMYGVNAGVPKSLVRYLVDYFAQGADSALAAVLRDVLDTPVSPELLPPDENGRIAQKTEEILGDYTVHDFFLYHFLRFGTEPQKLLFMAKRAFAGRYDEPSLRRLLELFLRRFFSQQFKRSCLPDGPKVGTVSLSPRGDWRMPSDVSADAWLSRLAGG